MTAFGTNLNIGCTAACMSNQPELVARQHHPADLLPEARLRGARLVKYGRAGPVIHSTSAGACLCLCVCVLLFTYVSNVCARSCVCWLTPFQ